jgi:hypothetical protein
VLTSARGAQAAVYRPTCRYGAKYQAQIPSWLGARPAGECNDPRRGRPAPEEAAAKVLAATVEKEAAFSLPPDAVQVRAVGARMWMLL